MKVLFWAGFFCSALVYGLRTGNDVLATAGMLFAAAMLDRTSRKRAARPEEIQTNEHP